MSLRCWDPYYSDESGGNDVEAADVVEAARKWASERYELDKYPEKRRVMVRNENGRLWAVDIKAEKVPFFSATAYRIS